MESIKRRIFKIIEVDTENDLASKMCDVFIMSLILINVSIIVLDTLTGIPARVASVFRWIEVFSVIVFTIEYLLRLWTANYLYPDLKPLNARLKYICSFMAAVDLLAILPFYIPYIFPIDLRVLRMVRLVRMLRILKVNRYTKALTTIAA